MAGFRVTYATLTADDSELQAAYTTAVEQVRSQLGATHPLWIGDDERIGETFTTVSPIDTSVEIGYFTQASSEDIDDAVAAARAARASWASTPWEQRCELLDRAADLISARSVVDGAALAWENGKSRLEAIGEVEEAADLIRYYTHAIRQHDGFAVPMERFSEAEVTSDVMLPYGVWAVIAPFNYPSALVAGPSGAALVAGNTLIIKPSEVGSLTGHLVYRALVDAGVPARRRQHRHGWRRRRLGAGAPLGRRRGHVHWLEFGRHVDHPLVLHLTSEARCVRDGGQEPGHHRRLGRSRSRRRRHRSQRVRIRRPEVLGRIAGVRAQSVAEEFIRAARRPRRGGPDRQPTRTGRLPLARRQPGGPRPLRRRRRRRPPHR